MESVMRRKPIKVKTDPKGTISDTDFQDYMLQTRGEYEDLMMEFEFRCRRAAMMHYYEASGYDRLMYFTELLSAVVGSVSATSVGVWLLKYNQDVKFSNLGFAGAFGVGIVFILQMLGKGSTRVMPSFKCRQQVHITTAAAWQRLAQKTRSYRIQLDNPKLDVSNYADWYTDVITEREKLSTMVSIPQSTYNLYCDAHRVYHPMKERRLMYLKFLQLEETDTDDIKSLEMVEKKKL